MRSTGGGSGGKKPPHPGPAGERALTRRGPSQPKSPDNRGGERGPHSFADWARRIVYHEQHYAENPRIHAQALRGLGLTARQVRQVHYEKVVSRHAHLQGPSFTSRLTGTAGHLTGLGVVDKAAQDLTTAALYTPAGLYQTARHPIRTAKAMPHQIAQDFRHPLRHPGYTALDVWGLASLGAGTVGKAGEIGRAASAGENVAKAAFKRKPPGRITYRQGDLTVETPASRNALRRAYQKSRATYLNKHPEHPGLVKKMGKGMERQQHFETTLAQAPAHLLESQGNKARKAGMQTALRVVAEGVPIEDRIRFHRERGRVAESSVERKDHALQIRRLRAARRYVEDVGGHPVIRADAPVLGRLYGRMKSAAQQRETILHDTGQMAPEGLESRKHAPGRVIEGARWVTGAEANAQIRALNRRDKALAREANRTKRKIKRTVKGIQTPDLKFATEQENAANAAAQAGSRSRAAAAEQVRKARGQLDRAEQSALFAQVRHAEGGPVSEVISRSRSVQDAQKALDEAKANARRTIRGGKALPAAQRAAADLRTQAEQQALTLQNHVLRQHAERLGMVARERGRVAESLATTHRGLSGAEDFKGGELYVPMFSTEARVPGAATRTGNVIGHVRNIVSKNKPFTGENLLHGQVPGNTTGLVARQTLRAVRFMQSDKFRQRLLLAAHDERRGPHDVLINDRSLKNPKLPPEVQALTGRGQFTLDELSGHATAFDQFQRKLFPMRAHNDYSALSPEERLAAQEGGKVKGYKWVDERLLRGANKPGMYVSSKAGKAATGLVDSINNASKLAILYLKPAYAIPNAVGNAFLNVVQQGFAAPKNLKAASYLSHKISEEAAAKLDSVMGEGIARSIQAEGGRLKNAVNFAAGKWSSVIDLPFRRAAFIHEARKLGYDTPTKLRALLEDDVHHADLMEAAQRANDAIIDYTRLNDFERSVVRRVIFFYPWVKGSAYYTGHYVAEHPLLAAATAHVAQQGKEHAGLGPVPSFLEGSMNVGGKLVNPQAAGIFGTSANVADAIRGVLEGHPKESSRLAQFATPAVADLLANITRQNSLGTPYSADKGLGAISQDMLLSSLPQAALLHRIQQYEGGGDQSRKLFPVKGISDVVSPFLAGGVAPRSYNANVLHSQALSETRSNMTRDQRRTYDYKKTTNDLRVAMRAMGEKRIPREVANLLNLRHERAAARDQAHSKAGRPLDAKERFASDVSVIVRHGWMNPEEQRQALKWAQTAQPAQLKSASRYLTDHYFDRDGLLSDSLKYLRDHGHDVKVPALPR